MELISILLLVKNLLLSNPEITIGCIIGIYEAIVRRKATEKDISIISKIVKFLNFILPNLKKGGGFHV